MAKFNLKPSDLLTITSNQKKIAIVKKESFDNFNEDILGLGKLVTKSTQRNALSVIFDLEGFTTFCRQIDPQLAVPEYLSEFLEWIFTQVRKETINETFKEGYSVYSDLPFLSKYLGDGLLFLWDTEKMGDIEMLNIVTSMHEICKKYTTEFLPKMQKKLTRPPAKLRCGIARGTIYSVGNGNDFVGPCINVSARLQKLHSLSFCFSRRGLNPEHLGTVMQSRFVTHKINIRGIGDGELVCVLKKEFEQLIAEDKQNFISL
jgi:class 3 adenylate cyclase